MSDLSTATATECSGCGRPLPDSVVECPACGHRDVDRLRAVAAEAVDNELAQFDALVVTDDRAVSAFASVGEMPGCRVVTVDDPAAPLATADPLVPSAAAAGKQLLTWCTPTDQGRRLAREAARTLDPMQPDGARVQHVTAVDPRNWQPAVQPWSDLQDGARSMLPSAPRTQRSNGAAAAKTEAPPFDTSPGEIAARVILRFGGELLVVDDDDYGTGYALDTETGIWRSGGDTWTDWLATLAHELTAEVVRSGLTGRALTSAVAQIQRLKRPGMVDQVRPMLRGMLRNIRRAGEPAHDVTECHARDLNANTRYIGVANGVVDLHGGKLLSPEQGRRHLVSLQASVNFDPEADDAYVDRLFAHLGDDAVRWWWRVLGFHLMGAPSRRFYVAVGPPAGGKSTLANALCGVLGPYAARPADDALEARPGGSAGLSPELEAFTLPRRWAVIDEAPRMKIAAPLLKRLSGDAETTYRRLHEQLRTVPVTATVLVICNPGSVPRLRLQDEAMADRLRELPYAAVPTPDPTFKARVQTDSFRRAFLARLVAAAAAETPREPPDAPPLVLNATADRIREDVGELGAFARLIVRGPDTMTVAALWEAWCQHNDEPATATEAGGINKRRLSSALRDHVPGLPAAKAFSLQGRKVRGWRGWQLLEEPPSEPAGTKSVGRHAGPILDPPLSDQERELIERVRNWDGNPDTAPEGLVMTVYEYDPPLERCPNGCRDAFRHLDAPEDPPEVAAWRKSHPERSTIGEAEWSDAVEAWREQKPPDSSEVAEWRKAGYPGRRECLDCGEVFEAAPLPPGGRKVAGWRPETPAEAVGRLTEAAKRRAEQQTPELPGIDVHPDATKAAEEFDGLF